MREMNIVPPKRDFDGALRNDGIFVVACIPFLVACIPFLVVCIPFCGIRVYFFGDAISRLTVIPCSVDCFRISFLCYRLHVM